MQYNWDKIFVLGVENEQIELLFFDDAMEVLGIGARALEQHLWGEFKSLNYILIPVIGTKLRHRALIMQDEAFEKLAKEVAKKYHTEKLKVRKQKN